MEQKYKQILQYLLENYPCQIIDLYSREENVRDLEPILIDMGISLEILDSYIN